ncbi:MAG: efflux RND transporter permease subunit [Candidatus Moranbacteria bacterium]|nr:efflux RND transporter permease subunit [Candidatus Moranbacteria bacterium]
MNEPNQQPSERKGKLGVAGRMTELFLRKRELSILAIVVVAAWGTLSFVLTPKQYNPEIVAPAFVIVTDFPNASASEVRELVTRPMEDAISELPKIDEISSQSHPGGRSIVMVKFLVGADLDAAKTALNQKLRDHMAQKPIGASDPVVQSIDPEDVPILDLGFTSDTLSESSLRKLAMDVTDELKRADGVSRAEVVGGRTNHLLVEPKSGELAAHGVTLQEIAGAISTSNGIDSVEHLDGTDRDRTIVVNGNIRGIEDLGNIIVAQDRGAVLRLRDIADISYGPGEITDYVLLSGRDGADSPVVHIALSKLKGTNATAVSKGVLSRLDSLKGTTIPSDVSVTTLRDEGAVAGEEIDKLTFDLTKSIVVVAVLLMMFLGFRNAMVAAVSIPLVLLAVFGAGLLAGQTVNRITLFALILSLGLLVDDAIVVIENIARYFRMYPGENRIRLIVRAVDEVGGALALSTLTMAISFIPMAFVTGMMGPYMAPIPFFVPAALFASLLFSVTVNPFLALIFTPKEKAGKAVAGAHGENVFLQSFQKLDSRYGTFLSSLLSTRKKRLTAILVTVALFLMAVVLPFSPLVPFRMLPKADKEQFYVYLDLPTGSDVSATRTAAIETEKTLLSIPEIENVESFIGEAPVSDFNGLFKGSSSRVNGNQATFRANLVGHDRRHRLSEEIASDFRKRAEELRTSHPDYDVRIMEDPPGPPVLATLYLKVKGDDERIREAVAQDFEGVIRGIVGTTDIDRSTPQRVLDRSYRILTDKAQLLGVAPTDIASTLHMALSGTAVGLYHESASPGLRKPEQEYVALRLARDSRDEESDLTSIVVASRTGAQVPLSELLEKTDAASDLPIFADGRQPTVSVSAEMEGRSVVYAVCDLFPKLFSYKLPDGDGRLVSWSPLGATYEDTLTGKRYSIEIGGEWKLTLDVFRDLGIAMGVAIFLIYFVLAAKAESLFVPLFIMVSIPLGLIGVFPGFALLHALKGTYFNATSMIGVISLAGLSVKNAVIFLEYLEPLKRAGKPLKEALIETGRVRLLPITLTSLTAILGSFTIISDPVWEGLAWAIIFGLTASTFLTLIIFPLVYYVFEKKHWDR